MHRMTDWENLQHPPGPFCTNSACRLPLKAEAAAAGAPRQMEVIMAKNDRSGKKDKQSRKEPAFPKRDQSVSGLGSIIPETKKGERPKAL